MAAELRKSPRPGSVLDGSNLPPPPSPPPGIPSDGQDIRSPTPPGTPKGTWGVRPTAQRVPGPSQSQRVTPMSATPPTSPLSASQPIPLPSDARRDSGGASANPLSQSQTVQRTQMNAALPTPPAPASKHPYGLDEKMMRSPSAPVLSQSPGGALQDSHDAARPRATLPSKALPPVPPAAGSHPQALSRPSSNSASVVSGSSPNLYASTPNPHASAGPLSPPTGLSHSAPNPTTAATPGAPQQPSPKLEERLSSGSLRQLEIPGDTPDTEQNILYGDGRVLRAATPPKLIEKLSNPGYDAAFTMDCIITYPLFCNSANEFLDALVLRYQNVQNAACRKKIVNEVIRTWIEANFDWTVEPNMRAFLQTVRTARNAESGLVQELFDLLDRMSRRTREGYNTFSAMPPDVKMLKPLMPKDLSKVHTIEDIHPKEMARQITLLASDIYKKIRVSELLKQAWSKKDKEKNAPNILHLINRFNKTSLWVASMCVLPETVPARASTISYFIKVAKEMREIRNFDGMISIINGLENSSVLRLKQSWAFVDGKQDLQLVKDMMTFDGNYKAYREHLASLDATEAVVPFIAPFLGDLTFIDENPNQINGLWNFGKCRMVAKSIQVALKFQKVDYPFESVPMVQKYLAKIRLPEEQDIYEVSIKREKKGEEDKAASIMVETLFS